MKKFLLLALCFIFQLLFAFNGNAQGNQPDFMRSIGKIYVVVAVIATIFIGIVLFLIFLERRISKMEKYINND